MTNDQMADFIHANTYDTREVPRNAIDIEDLMKCLPDYLDEIFFNFDKEKFIRRCKGE